MPRKLLMPILGTVVLAVIGAGAAYAAQVAGTIQINMTDFGITPPSVPFTTVEPNVTIEVSLALIRAA